MPRSIRGRSRPPAYRADPPVEDYYDQMDCPMSSEFHPSSRGRRGTLAPGRRLPYYFSDNMAVGLGAEGDCLGMLLGYVLGLVSMGIIWILVRNSNIPALFKDPDDTPAPLEPVQ